MIWVLPVALRPLPFRLRVNVGGAMISGLISAIPSIKRRITDNLTLIYPEHSTKENKALFNKIRRHIGRRFIETFYAVEYLKRLDEMHISPSDIAKVQSVLDTGRPVFIVSGHFGNWVAGRAVLMHAGITTGALYRVSANPIFEKHFIKTLTAGGEPIVPTGIAGMRMLIKHLRKGGTMSVLLDQRVAEGPVLSFMGKPAHTSTSIAELALKYNAALMPLYTTLRDDNQNIDIEIEDEIPHSDPITMTQAINDSLSTRVWKNPEQWYWLHRRWLIVNQPDA